MAALKEQLHRLCTEYLASREAEIKDTITGIRTAAAGETKSSAGDKYETTREVMQQEIDLNLARLQKLRIMSATLSRISPAQNSVIAGPGAIVYTTNGNYYIAISAGRIQSGPDVFYAISAASPLGAMLAGKKAGHTFQLNGQTFTIQEIL